MSDHTGKGALALSDSLSLVRQVIAASGSTSLAELVSTMVQALMSHQDIDGCELFIRADAKLRHQPSASVRGSSGIPPTLVAWLITEVFPLIVENPEVRREPELHHCAKDLQGSVLAVPINTADETIGSLAIWNERPNHFLPWHETLVQMIVEVLALALTCQPKPEHQTSAEVAAANLAAHSAAARPPAFPTGPNPGQTLDPLTGLADRMAFELSLHELSALPTLTLRSCFVLYLDIDRFRLIREYGGPMTAERVVRTLAEILQQITGTELALGRLGIDEFAVVIERHALEHAVAVADALVNQVDEIKMTFAGQRYDVSISVGVAQLDARREPGPAALRRAIQACRAAQSLGGGTVQVYHERLTGMRSTGNDGWMLNQLTRALKSDGLEIYAQPITMLCTESENVATQPSMHELLLRLRDADGQICSADAFLPIAERYGLSVRIDRLVIESAFRQIAESPFTDKPQHRFTLNLSGHSIDNHQLLDFIMQQFEASRLPPERICFEITETAAISDISTAKEFVDALRQLGCQFALDDFGSGHSSFLYLRDLPVDYLKIDGELVRDIVNDPVSLAFVRTIQGVGKLMKRRTIAEYVQSQEIYDAIRLIGCDYAQGYWVGCPMPLADVLSRPPE